jgi:hypothetical protein
MITTYISISEDMLLQYENGTLKAVDIINPDRVCFDALRNEIELYESDLSTKYFTKYVHNGDF